MDMVYHAIKNFLKSFINLFVAVIELITTLINGVASILGKLRPRVSEKYTEIKNNKYTNTEEVKAIELGEEEQVKKVREQLNEKITSRDKYLLFYSKVRDEGISFYAIVIAILGLVFAGGIVVSATYVDSDISIMILMVMLLACAAACVIIRSHRKKTLEYVLIRRILEEEFKDKKWDTADEPIMKEAETVAALTPVAALASTSENEISA